MMNEGNCNGGILTPSLGRCLALLALFFLPPACHPEGGAAGEKLPNFLIFDIDSLRADRVAMALDGRVEAPALAGLAACGVVFEQVYSSSGWTAPALAALLTGRHPELRRVSSKGRWGSLPRVDDSRTLPEILTYYDYQTAVFWGETLPGKGGALERGFEEQYRLNPELFVSYHQLPTAWLALQARQPFFALVHNIDLHRARPSVPQGASRGMQRSFPACLSDNLAEFVRDRPRRTSAAEAAAIASRRYDCGLAYYDNSIAQILEALDASDLADNTVVIVTSNHGESLLEHGLLGHDLLYEEILRVPLVVVDPAIKDAQRVTQRVQLTDLAPSILARAGLHIDQQMVGASFLPLMGLGEGEYAPRDVFSMTSRDIAALRKDDMKLLKGQSSLRGGRSLFRWSTEGLKKGELELYDLAQDPGEQRDLAAAQPEQVEALDQALSTWVAERFPDENAAPTEMEETLREALEERGYWELVVDQEQGAGTPANSDDRLPADKR